MLMFIYKYGWFVVSFFVSYLVLGEGFKVGLEIEFLQSTLYLQCEGENLSQPGD